MKVSLLTDKVPSLSVLTPNSDKYRLSLPKPFIGPVVRDNSLSLIEFTVMLLYKGPSSTVSDPCLVKLFNDVLAVLTASIKL